LINQNKEATFLLNLINTNSIKTQIQQTIRISEQHFLIYVIISHSHAQYFLDLKKSQILYLVAEISAVALKL